MKRDRWMHCGLALIVSLAVGAKESIAGSFKLRLSLFLSDFMIPSARIFERIFGTSTRAVAAAAATAY